MWKRVFQDWHEDTVYWVRHGVPKLLVIFIMAFVLVRLLHAVTGKLIRLSNSDQLPTRFRSQQLRTLASVVNSVGTFVVIFVALLQILPLFQIDVKPLLASAGIVGLAIGFGAQTLVHDVINGFLILVENQYAIGDTVKVAGVSGTVEEMSLRKTILRDANGTLHSVPNSEIKIVSNLTRDWSQVSLTVAVDYSEPSDKIIGLLQEIGTELRNDPQYAEVIVADPEVPGIERVQGPEVDYLMLVKVRPGEQFAVSRELRRKIKSSFEQNKIKPGGPSRVYVTDGTASATQS